MLLFLTVDWLQHIAVMWYETPQEASLLCIGKMVMPQFILGDGSGSTSIASLPQKIRNGESVRNKINTCALQSDGVIVLTLLSQYLQVRILQGAGTSVPPYSQ
jgi:hypothetical protein